MKSGFRRLKSAVVNSPIPYSEDLERAVLGAIMMKPEVLSNGITLTPAFFYLTKHQVIAQAIFDLQGNGAPADLTNVVQHLSEKNKLKQAGGAYYVSGLYERASIDIKHDLKKLRELAEKRGVREQAIRVARADFNLPLSEIEGSAEFVPKQGAAAPPPLSNSLQAEVDSWLAGDSKELESILEPLKDMPLLQREQYRKRVCEKADIRAGIFDMLVKVNSESESQGGAIGWEEIIPWPESVNGTSLLDELVTTFQRYIVLPEGAAETIALWTIHTHCHEATFVSPYLVLTSPEKRCGKTLTLELLSTLVPKPLPSSNISPSSLFRAVEKWRPTLLIDEADTFIKRNEELAGILNSGHTRTSAFVLRSVGDDFEPRRFSTWTPKAIALIGNLKDTLRDRSIIVTMRRKTRSEKIERFRQDRTGEFEIVRRKMARWVSDHFDVIEGIDPEVPGTLDDRQQDNWRPLLSIADVAGGEWPSRARQTAETLSSSGDTDSDSYRIQLLQDIQEVFEKAGFPESIKTADLLTALNGMEDRPWCELRQGKPMSARTLANMLKPYRIVPGTIRLGDSTAKGYRFQSFEDAFRRYTLLQSVTPLHSLCLQGLEENTSVTKGENVTDRISPKPNNHSKCYAVTDRKPLPGGGKGIQCVDCQHFIPDPGNPAQGIGKCQVDAAYGPNDPARYPKAKRNCKQFQAAIPF